MDDRAEERGRGVGGEEEGYRSQIVKLAFARLHRLESLWS